MKGRKRLVNKIHTPAPAVILLTGLSGSGKTTLGNAIMKYLIANGRSCVFLDGDDMRKIFNDTAFDEASRKAHNLRVTRIAALLEEQGQVVIMGLIAPYHQTRREMRELCNRFLEVYLNASLEVCRERDVKGLYAKAERGEIASFTGLSAPYEVPENPNLVLDTSALPVEECRDRILALL
jgi:adenylyl-sulfate kinase